MSLVWSCGITTWWVWSRLSYFWVWVVNVGYVCMCMSQHVDTGDKARVPWKKNISHSHFDLNSHLKSETKGFYSTVHQVVPVTWAGLLLYLSFSSLWFSQWAVFTFLRSSKQSECWGCCPSSSLSHSTTSNCGIVVLSYPPSFSF